MKNKTLDEIAHYYSEKIAQHGVSPQGVDWNSNEGQFLRFEQLTKIINEKESFSLYDIGCGYGALHDYLNAHYPNFMYTGYDISPPMIEAARDIKNSFSNACFVLSANPQKEEDYGVASGIFNVRLNQTDEQWLEYIYEVLGVINRTTRLGFSFNCLTKYSDKEKMQEHRYYADPCQIFDYCKKNFSRNVALLHDYNLYEFTILVRKL